MASSKRIGFCLTAALLALTIQPALAQGVTGKTVRLIVPYPAGGTGDVVARVLGQAITEKTGQTIVVEDRPGASSIVGSEFVARADLRQRSFVLFLDRKSTRLNSSRMSISYAVFCLKKKK